MRNTIKQTDLTEIKNELTNTILVALSTLGFIAVVFSTMRSLEVGFKPLMAMQFTVWLISTVLYFKRHYFSQQIKAYSLVCMLCIIGVAGVLTFGLTGGGTVVLFSTAVICALLINIKFSISIVIVSAFVIGLTSFLQYNEIIKTPQLVTSKAVLYAWLTELVGFALFAVTILLAIEKFLRHLKQTNVQLTEEVEQHAVRAQQSERLLKAVLDALPYRVFWKDAQLNYLGANKAFLQDGGLTTVDEIIGKSDHDMPWKSQADLFRADDQEVIQSRQAKLNIEEPLTSSDGKTNYLLTNKVPLIDEHQHVFGVLGAFDDISAQKELEIELRKAKVSADQASIAKSEFLANMSHEIRTPLNGINGLLALALATELDEQQRDYLAKTQDSAKLLHAILNDILDISKIEAGKLELEQLDFTLADLVDQLTHLLTPLAIEKNITLQVVNHVNLDTVFLGDSTRLMQILLNLINNAIKFTEIGQVSVTFTYTSQQEKPSLTCKIIDTGIGISAEQLPCLFKNFSQGDNSMSRRFGGTGLGLSIVKKIVELMQGTINVDSEVGRGSTFSLSLPLTIGAKKSISQPEHAPKASDISLQGIQILVVEDNKINQLIVKKVLTQYNATVTIANDGLEALSILEKESFALILMDIQMPNMNGCEAIQAIRAQKALADIPVIALTANVMSHEVESYYKLGFNAHIGKPFQSEELIEKIEQLVNTANIAVS